MLTTPPQALMNKALAQETVQERFQKILAAFYGIQSPRLRAPPVRPVSDVQIISHEGWRRLRFNGPSGLSRSAHIMGFSDLPVAQLPLEVARERIDPNTLDGLSVALEVLALAPTLGTAQVMFVGALVAGVGTAPFLDEAFEQDRPIGVAGLLVIR